MRLIFIMALIASATALKAQTPIPGIFGNQYGVGLPGSFQVNDSSSQKKWFFSRYSAISSGVAFFRGGSATIFSVPMGMQLSRRLNNNLFAFTSVSLTPAYVNFSRSFIANDFNKTNQNNYFRPGNMGVYSRAELGLQYINDEKTFSISGSIGVERSSYPVFQNNQTNSNRTNHPISGNR